MDPVVAAGTCLFRCGQGWRQGNRSAAERALAFQPQTVAAAPHMYRLRHISTVIGNLE
jgi:hypothetical protein